MESWEEERRTGVEGALNRTEEEEEGGRSEGGGK